MSADIVNPADHVDAIVSVLNDVVAQQLGVMLSAQDADALMTGLAKQGFVLVEARDLEDALTATETPEHTNSATARQIHVHVNLPENVTPDAIRGFLASL